MSVRGLIHNYVERTLSRRQFIRAMAATGVTLGAARAMAEEFSPFVRLPEAPDSGQPAGPEPLPDWAQTATGTGGQLLVEQLKAAGCRYLFINPSTGHVPIFDALVDEPNLHIIQMLHEGHVAAVADGYGRASRKTPFVMVSRLGLTNAMTQMFNAWKDYTAMVVMVDGAEIDRLGQDSVEVDYSMLAPIVKWQWSVETVEKIPEVVRRSFKFASTRPQRPVFFACPEDLLQKTGSAAVLDQSRYDIRTEVRPSAKDTSRIAGLLLEARNPLIYAGDDVRYCNAEAELLALAEMLSIPVVNDFTGWSKPFPTDHDLYAGMFQPTARYPGAVDVMLHLGSRLLFGTGKQLRLQSQVRLVQVGLDSVSLGHNFPSELAIVADVKLALGDLIQELKARRTAQHARVASRRLERAKEYRRDRQVMLESIRRERWDRTPMSGERLVAELDDALPLNAAVVAEIDTHKALLETSLRYGPGQRELFTQAGYALGWGMPAALGVKLAIPERPVVAVVSDGSFLFSGGQCLWSFARYKAPVTILVLNNRSYNGERNRIMMTRGRTYQTGRDMACYIGDPDIQFVKIAAGYGVEGQQVTTPDELRAALSRAWEANAAGKPYLLDVHMERVGTFAESSWHPEFQIANLAGKG